MSLVDPLSKSPFSISVVARIRWIGFPLSRFFIAKARKAARRMDWPKACATYIRALQLCPKNGSAWVQLGHNLGHLGHTDATQIAYINATQMDPQLSTGHKHLGLVRYNTSLHETGMNSLACALFLNPDDTDLRNLMVGEEGEAKVEARTIIAALTLADHHPAPAYIGPRATILRARARAAARRRQWNQAEKLYRRLTRMRPDDAHSFIQLGHALNEQNKQVEAENAFRRAAAAAPLFPDAWLHLGYVLTARKQHLKAREAFAVVNRLAPARRGEHPILESADPMPQTGTHLPDTSLNKRLTCPDGLGHREKSIWLRLATRIEREL